MDKEADSLGLFDNPLGRVTFDKAKFVDFFLDNPTLVFADIADKTKHGNLAEEVGSRVHSWRVMLGLLPLERAPEKWVAKLREQRQRFYKISEKYSIQGTKNLDPMMFNPLMPGKNNLWNEMLEDKDTTDTIYKDIVRTYQEYRFFNRKEIIDQIVSTLYYWSKAYPMFSYRQGMNEIIAVIYFAFYAEKAAAGPDVDKKTDAEIAADTDLLVKFMFNPKHVNADVFVVFERVMSMGVKELYGTIDDISAIKSQLFDEKADDRDRLFKWKYEVEQEDKERRAKIEKIYDDERKKSAVMRRCNRIYHNYLKKIDADLYKHLVHVRLDPELQLMRWLR
jgi:TBC1 domain family protein 5